MMEKKRTASTSNPKFGYVGVGRAATTVMHVYCCEIMDDK